MKRITILSFALVFSMITLSVCAQNKKAAEKLFSDLIGTWRIQTIYDGQKDITKNDSTSVQWLQFTEDGRYRSQAGKQALDSGSYRVNENHHILYLQSDTDKDNPAEWQVEFKDSTMILSGKGTPHAAQFRYVYIKTKDKENANRPIRPQQ